MRHEGLAAVDRDALTTHVRRALARYWPVNVRALERVAQVQCPFPRVSLPLKLLSVRLPEWAADCGVDGSLMVPCETCADPQRADWPQVDWWLAMFLMLEGWHERVWEQHHGVIHSYSFRLRGWDPLVWQRAWVNRIALFLRIWAAREAAQEPGALFGALPHARISMTHDVDAIAKTASIRLKQSAFMAFNAVRLLARAHARPALARARQALRFAFGNDDWSVPEAIVEIERRAGLRSQFNFYADNRSKNIERWLFDPTYDVAAAPMRETLASLVQGGWTIGLHASHDAWRTVEPMRAQRERLQSLLPVPVTAGRQHWLRFSWRDTWSAQAQAGIRQDTTLMFNDRPGLRCAAALSWTPWDPQALGAHQITALPTMLMDSHVYDYQLMDAAQRRAAFRHWIGEIVAVGGEAAVLWHPHTITPDYGWKDGFVELIAELSAG